MEAIALVDYVIEQAEAGRVTWEDPEVSQDDELYFTSSNITGKVMLDDYPLTILISNFRGRSQFGRPSALDNYHFSATSDDVPLVEVDDVPHPELEVNRPAYAGVKELYELALHIHEIGMQTQAKTQQTFAATRTAAVEKALERWQQGPNISL